MDKRKLWNLISAPGLAVTSLLFVFLLLGWHTAGATLDGDSTFSEIRAPSATFTVSGTVTCEATGPIADVEVSAWDQLRSSVVASDTTDSSGTYSVTLDEGTYYLELVPPAATGLNARAFTTMEILTNTVLDVNFCVCSGIWVTETVDSAGDVGLGSSLALAPTYPYTPHIGYTNFITEHDYDLKHAYLSGTTWFSETVDRRGGEAPSLELAPTYPYTPCVSYHDFWEKHDLRYACRNSSTWTIMPIVSGLWSKYPSLALEPTYPYTPHISYFAGLGVSLNPGHAYLSGTTWCSGTWVREPIEPAGSRVGWDSSLALEPAYPYTPHVSYFDYITYDLRHAWLSRTTWLTEIVDSAGAVGRYTSLELDSRDNPHVSYFDGTNETLKHAWLSGSTWFSETVDGIGNPHEEPEDWGTGYTSLELDQADVLYISYYDAVNDDLKLARFDGTVWIIQTVDSTGDVGQCSSLALDRLGCPHISYYDAINGDLKYAYVPRRYWVHLPLVLKDLGP